MDTQHISREKQWLAVGPVGGSTVVVDYAGLRLVVDPTFDPPGRPDGAAYERVIGPAVSPEELGRADAVLLSHDQHPDNLDVSGRAYALDAGLLITTPGGAARIGAAIGLGPWQTTELDTPGGTKVILHALPAVHGPLDGDRDQSGHVNAEVTGFLLTAEGLPTIYISGDNASIAAVAEIAARHPTIDIAVLFAGAARVAARQGGRPLTLTAERAADAAILLRAPRVVPAHCRGWSHYSQSPEELVAAFDDAGVGERLVASEPGTWAILSDRGSG
ncbi:MAG TPA: MBL fold metallo-hydrolase [Solirubrobacteraceae bacterium]|jgi:L-ascorbate metabolism protein UlaG (beta-lactamase superfamily)|nr:MBL fold metallo-hydrolase [Solirubrobacteraceae bacterium]